MRSRHAALLSLLVAAFSAMPSVAHGQEVIHHWSARDYNRAMVAEVRERARAAREQATDRAYERAAARRAEREVRSSRHAARDAQRAADRQIEARERAARVRDRLAEARNAARARALDRSFDRRWP